MDQATRIAAIRSILADQVAYIDALDRQGTTAFAEARSKGRRIIDGGQTDHTDAWIAKDYDTGAILAEGVGRGTWDELWDANPSWAHVDAIAWGAFEDVECPQETHGLDGAILYLIQEMSTECPDEARALLIALSDTD